MRNIININLLLIGALFAFAGCQTAAEKNTDAINDVSEAKEDLQSAKEAANIAEQNLLQNNEWIQFRKDALIQIEDNEKEIAILRIKKEKSGRTFDTLYGKRIDQLESDNKALKQRISDYETSQSDWEKFKTEFNRDMTTLGKALNDLTIDNEK
jgi:TolA-binding protein